MLKTRSDEYLQKGLTGKIVNIYRSCFLKFSPCGARSVENPVENVENIHFALYNFIVKKSTKPCKDRKMPSFYQKTATAAALCFVNSTRFLA
jgi:hypothetical protein